MKDKTVVSEAIEAYIIPSGDAHQVTLTSIISLVPTLVSGDFVYIVPVEYGWKD